MKYFIIIIVILVRAVLAGTVDQAIKIISANTLDQNLPLSEVKKLENQMSRMDLVAELATTLEKAESPLTELAACRMVLGIRPFPFNEVSQLLSDPQTNSYKRAYLLFLLNEGSIAPAEVAIAIETAKAMLSDKGKGTHRFGEARAYSADGMRVCDIAYNVLVARLELNPPMMSVDVDNFVADKRDALILDLARRASIRLTSGNPSAAINTTSPQAPALVPPAVPKLVTEAEITSAPPSEKPTLSTPWSVVVALVVVAISLIGLIWKQRK
jgi:hypothetical protein